MKNLLIALTLILTSNFIFAQSQLGIKFVAPTVSSNTASKDFYHKDSGQLYKLNHLSTRTSYSYGLSLYNNIGDNWWLSADALYRKRQVDFKMTPAKLTRSSNSYSDNYNEIVLPIAAGFRKNNFKVGLGPTFTYTAKSELSLTDLEGFTNNERKVKTGFQFMIGYTIKDRIHIDLKRELNFSGTGDDYKFNHKNLNLKSMPHTFSLSASIYL